MSHGHCDYCGLPSVDFRSAKDRAFAERKPTYCCFGCRFAARIAQSQGDVAQARWLMTRLGLAVFLSMNVMVFTMFLWSQDVAWDSVPSRPLGTESQATALYDLARHACLLFTIPVVLLLGGPLLDDAISELRRGQASLSLLLTVGVLAAFGYSVVSVLRGGHVYFEVACTVLVAVTLGRWFEATGKLQTTEALRSLEKLLPDEVRRVVDGRDQLVPRDSIRPGDAIRILPGERIAIDGRIAHGQSAVDQQSVTGESIPRETEPGDEVFSGTLNLDGELLVTATSRADQGTLPRLIESVRRATAIKGRYQRLAEHISTVFVPLVGVIALATFFFHGHRSGYGEGILAGLSVLVIACPCALGLATPMALWVAIGKAARELHVVFRDGDALTKLAAADLFCFDKTGTLTTGEPTVAGLVTDGETTPDEILSMAAELAVASTHPYSRAVVRHTDSSVERGRSVGTVVAAGIGDASTFPPAFARRFATRTLAGRGLVSCDDAYFGSLRLMCESGQIVPESLAELPTPAATYIAWDGRVRGAFLFRDAVRRETADALRRLNDQGHRLVMLTGDRREQAVALARQLKIESRAELLPEDKLATIAAFRREGHTVVMVGDGINDAPALAAADVGISLGCGTDISRHSADVCLLANDLRRLADLVALARNTTRTIRWNLVWAFGYNTLGIGLAVAGLLNPIVAAVAMAVSSLLVVTNSLRLGRTPCSNSP